MTNLASYILAGLAAVLVADYFNPIVGTSPAPFGAVGADPAATISTQVVDRSHKGDRLDRPPQAILTVRDFQVAIGGKADFEKECAPEFSDRVFG